MPKFALSHSRLRYMLEILLTAGIYFILATLSLFLQFQTSNATPVWPPSGFAFAIILLLGYRVAPGIMLGAFAANIFIFLFNKTCDWPTAIWSSFVVGIGNTGESLVGYYLLKKMIPNMGVNNFFLKVNYIFRFSFIAGLMCLVSCTIGATAVFLAQIITSNQYSVVWFTWWMGDFSGILLVTPFILIWTKFFQAPSTIFTPSWKRKTEATTLFFTVLLCSGFIFDNWFFSLSIFKWAFWIIPVLAWAALRFNQRETVTAIALCSAIAIWGTVNRHGPFAVLSLNESLLTVQERTAEIVNTANELAEKNKELLQQKEFIETLFDSVEDLMAVFDTQGNYLSVNKKIEEVYKVSKDVLIGKNILECFPEVRDAGMYNDLQQAIKGEMIHNFSYRSAISERYFENFYIPLKNNNQ